MLPVCSRQDISALGDFWIRRSLKAVLGFGSWSGLLCVVRRRFGVLPLSSTSERSNDKELNAREGPREHKKTRRLHGFALTKICTCTRKYSATLGNMRPKAFVASPKSPVVHFDTIPPALLRLFAGILDVTKVWSQRKLTLCSMSSVGVSQFGLYLKMIL